MSWAPEYHVAQSLAALGRIADNRTLTCAICGLPKPVGRFRGRHEAEPVCRSCEFGIHHQQREPSSGGEVRVARLIPSWLRVFLVGGSWCG